MKLSKYLVTAIMACTVWGSAYGLVLWEAGYDSDYSGTTGTVHTGGQVSLANGEVQVGAVGVGDGSYLRYEDIQFLLPANGSVRVRFRVSNPALMIPSALFTSYYGNNPFDNYMWFGLYSPTLVLVRSHSSLGSPAGEVSYSATIPPISAGVHDMELRWQQTIPFSPLSSPTVREQADLMVYLDGTAVVSLENVSWTRWGNSYFDVGCFYNTQNAMSWFACGNAGITIDEVLIEQTPAVALECGEGGTAYLSADINQDCYVDLADWAIMVGHWLTCTHPTDGACN